jgi:hypothetical protein
LSKDVCCDHGAERGREKQRLESVFHIEVIAETIPRSGSWAALVATQSPYPLVYSILKQICISLSQNGLSRLYKCFNETTNMKVTA